jgi:hypothetical protein
MEQSIKYRQILSLALLNAVVVFSWIAYNNYQPKVLTRFDVTELADIMAWIQALIMVSVPPLAGIVADALLKQGTKKFTVFTIGISMTSMVFMAVAFSIQGGVFEQWKALIPLLIVLWLISMNVFISPANSMIELFAPGKQLPLVMGIIVLITDLVSAVEPLIIDLVDALGATYTFLGGGVLIAIAGYFFHTSMGNVSFERTYTNDRTESNFVWVIIAGLLLGSIFLFFFIFLPFCFISKIDSTGGNLFVSFVFLGSALAALPFSYWVERIGAEKGLWLGLWVAAIGLLILFWVGTVGMYLTFGVVLAIGLSLASVSAFPFALGKLSSKQVTLGTGLFFGATEVVDQLLTILI